VNCGLKSKNSNNHRSGEYRGERKVNKNNILILNYFLKIIYFLAPPVCAATFSIAAFTVSSSPRNFIETTGLKFSSNSYTNGIPVGRFNPIICSKMCVLVEDISIIIFERNKNHFSRTKIIFVFTDNNHFLPKPIFCETNLF